MTSLTGQPLVDKARSVAEQAHDGQFRADGVTPYIEHPLQVERELLQRWGNVRISFGFFGTEPDDEFKAQGRAIALLHDTLEHDCAHPLTLEDLRAAGFADILADLELLTKPPEMSYLDYILRLRGMGRVNPLAFWSKIADFAANELTLSTVPSKSRQRNMLTKWQMARWILTH